MEVKKKTYFKLKKKIENHFNFLKSKSNIQQKYLKSIEVTDKIYLLPIEKLNFHKYNFLNLKKNTVGFEIINNKNQCLGFFSLSIFFNRKLYIKLCNIHLLRKNNINFKKIILSLSSWTKQTFYIDDFLIEINKKDTYLIKMSKILNFKIFEKISKKNYIIFYSLRNFAKKRQILTAGPSISALEKIYTYDATSYGWNNLMSKYLDKFEEEVCLKTNTNYSISTSSATGALQIALMALDIGCGDEVIVPDLCWVSAPNAVQYVGATPVFCEVSYDNWNIDIQKLEKKITKKTKAIIPVHMYGQPMNMNEVINFARKKNIRIIEDAAPALGSTWKNKSCGSFGDFAVFSFQGAKILSIGEGGVLVTKSKKNFVKAKKIWNQGKNLNKIFWIDRIGLKFKMSNLQASLGLAQIQRLDELVWMKRRIFSWYKENLYNFKKIKLVSEIDNSFSNYWMSSLYVKDNRKKIRDYLITELKKNKIDSRPTFPAVSQYPIWNNKNIINPISRDIGNRGLNLPSGVTLTKEDIFFISKTIKNILN